MIAAAAILPWFKLNWLTVAKWVAIAAVVFAIFGAGWKLRDYQAAEDEAVAAKAQADALQAEIDDRVKKEEKYQSASEAFEKAIAQLREQKERVRTVKVREYVRAENVACPVSDDGMQLLSNAIAEANAARAAR